MKKFILLFLAAIAVSSFSSCETPRQKAEKHKKMQQEVSKHIEQGQRDAVNRRKNEEQKTDDLIRTIQGR